MTRTSLIVAACWLAIAPLAGFSQTPSSSDLTEVVYPVAHLVLPVNGANRAFTCERELMKVVLTKVSPKSWEKAGGPGTMRYVEKGLTLKVRQTAAVHEELARFLKSIELPQIRIVTRHVYLPESIFGADEMKWKKVDGVEAALMDEVGLVATLARCQENRRTHILAAPTLMLSDGDLGQFDCTEPVNYISGIEKQAVADGFQLQAKEEAVKIGVLTKFRPTLARDRKSIALDLSLSTSNVHSWKYVPAESVTWTPKDGNPARTSAVRLKTPVLREYKVSASATIPDRRTLVFRVARIVPEPVKRSPFADVPLIGSFFPADTDTEPMLFLWFVSAEVCAEEREDVWQVAPLRTDLKNDDTNRLPRYSWRSE